MNKSTHPEEMLRGQREAFIANFCPALLLAPSSTATSCPHAAWLATSFPVPFLHRMSSTSPFLAACRKCITTAKARPAQSGEVETKKEVTAFKEVKTLVRGAALAFGAQQSHAILARSHACARHRFVFS